MAQMSNSQQIDISLLSKNLLLKAILSIPKNAKKIIIFAHGSGSSRYSPRNQFVAKTLVDQQLAILLLDLLTPDEERLDLETRELRFNILFLANRLIDASNWINKNPSTQHLKIGYFGSSTGAAAALIAAAEQGSTIFSVVSRGGRPDLAASALHRVSAPTLLIVGGRDVGVIEFNEQALTLLQGIKHLEIIPGATHLFEEPGTLKTAADIATAWFKKY